MSLLAYKRKRDFKRTCEPRPKLAARSGHLRFVIQKHAASHLHACDFDHDGNLDVGIAQNSQEWKLYHNRLAKPGLRVVLKGSSANPDGIGTVPFPFVG